MEKCPKEEMWSVVSNNPKQGKDFREFRGEIMNVGIDYVVIPRIKIQLMVFNEWQWRKIRWQPRLTRIRHTEMQLEQ